MEEMEQEIEEDRKRDEVKEFEKNAHNININLEVEAGRQNLGAVSKESSGNNQTNSQKSNELASDKDEEDDYNKKIFQTVIVEGNKT